MIPSHGTKVTQAEMQVAQWDFQNKGRSRWTGTSCIVLEVPLCNLRPIMCNFVLDGTKGLLILNNQVGGLYGRILTEVVSTD